MVKHNPAVQLDGWDFISKILHNHLDNIEEKSESFTREI